MGIGLFPVIPMVVIGMMFRWFHADLIKSDGDNLFPPVGFQPRYNARFISVSQCMTAKSKPLKGKNIIIFNMLQNLSCPAPPLIKTGTSTLAVSPMTLLSSSILGESDKKTWQIVSMFMDEFAIQVPRVLLGLGVYFTSETIIFF
jgi:hypothetical protein